MRLRLTRHEVSVVGRGGTIEELVEFAPGESLLYCLECGGERVTARFDGRRVTVRVPETTAREWSKSDRVGIEAEQRFAPDRVLRVLIEKDFACLTSREGEDDADAFPNPNETC